MTAVGGAGMRFGEITGLTWDRVDLKEGFVTLRPEDTKTSKPRRVYPVPQAIEVLERARKVRGISHCYVFTCKGRPVSSTKTTLKTALRETGIKRFTFHDLRRTFNTNMQRAGLRNTVTMELTGHKTLAMFTRYSSVDPSDAQEAVASFASFLAKEGETTSHSASHAKKGLGTECLSPRIRWLPMVDDFRTFLATQPREFIQPFPPISTNSCP